MHYTDSHRLMHACAGIVARRDGGAVGQILLFGDHRGEPFVVRSCRFTKSSREREAQWE